MTVVKLDAGSITREYTRRAIIGINKALPVLLEELKRLTPEDTKEMLDSYIVTKSKSDGNAVVGVIGNEAKHAIYVEWGRSGVKFGYHKPKGSLFYIGEGNRTFARAVDNKRDEIIQIIYNEINR